MTTTESPLLYLSASEVRRALPMAEAVEAMRDAFGQLSSGQVTLPPRQHLNASEANGVALVMPCYSQAQKLFSVKLVTVFDENPKRGLPLIQSLVMLTDGATGRPVAMMDGASVTAIRTGAASGLATDLLARRDATIAAIFGAGVQARTQLEAVCCVRSIQHVRVCDPDAAAAERFAVEMAERLGVAVERVDSSAEAVKEAHVICCATTASRPVFEDGELSDGVHINAVGAFRPGTAEVPPATVCRARVVVDHRPAALEEAGDLIGPLQEGLITESHIRADLGEIVLGQAPGRQDDREVTFFKSVGVAIQDLCAAARVWKSACEHRLGTTLS